MIFNPLPGLPGQDFRIIQGFYDNPNNHYTVLYGLKGHSGYDLAGMTPGQMGIMVYAPHDGSITQLDFGTKGYGKHVQIMDKVNGRMTTLGHFQRFFGSPLNGVVKQGDPVGVMGQTGDATGIHVHFDYCHIDVNGNILNKNNGYDGRVPVAEFVRLWYPQVLGPSTL